MRKIKFLKIKYLLSLLIFVCIFEFAVTQANSTQDEPRDQKLVQYLEKCQNFIFNIFCNVEYCLINFHKFVVNELELGYPLDLLFFMLLGTFFFYIKSSFSLRKEYIYNHYEQPDLSLLLNSVNNFII
jgi:hypothetical protein